MQTIIEMRFGSHLYGTATPSSDLDIKAIHIPDARSILLQRAPAVISRKTKADKSAKNTADDTDFESYALHKYLALVAEGQTVALDMLFSTPDTWLIEPGPIWLEIQANRSRLRSRQCKSFMGYCRQQANKYGIKGSRMNACRHIVDLLAAWMAALGPRAKLGKIEDVLAAFVAGREHAALVDIELVGQGKTVRHLEVCNRKAPFTQTIKESHAVYDRLFQEYGARARAAESNDGIDWKALSHAVRVGRQAIEFLDTGVVTFPRPEAAHLLAIKTGQLDYHLVATEIEQLLELVERAAERSRLPEQPDHAFIDDFVATHYGARVTG